MEERTAEDLGEEIISRLKRLILFLEEKVRGAEDEKKLSNTSPSRN